METVSSEHIDVDHPEPDAVNYPDPLEPDNHLDDPVVDHIDHPEPDHAGQPEPDHVGHLGDPVVDHPQLDYVGFLDHPEPDHAGQGACEGRA